jgi:hypothetical protein
MIAANRNPLLIISCLLFASIEAFMQSPFQGSAFRSTKLQGYIAADSTDEEVDMTLGGVGLAEQSALLMIGNVDKKGGAIANDLKRYTDVSELKEQSFEKHGVTVLSTGEGMELYKDPGSGSEKTIILAPLEAIENALVSIDDNAAKDAKKILINFTGGDDLMVHEVLDSVEIAAASLNLPKIEFRSLCHKSFPAEKCCVAILKVSSESDLTEDIYWHEGNWWTLRKENLNTAVA